MSLTEYDYKCRKCQFTTTLQARLSTPQCEVCNDKMVRVYHPPALAFKGGGFTRNSVPATRRR